VWNLVSQQKRITYTRYFMWVWILVFYQKGTKYTEGTSEQIYLENVWT
jgi:hypothetical protein